MKETTTISSETLALDANLAQVTQVHATTRRGCEDCIRMGGQEWVHLNLCRVCGHVGCCDNSPNKHATKHFHDTKHAIIQRFEPGEDWGWDYETQQMLKPFPAELATAERHITEAEGYRRYSYVRRGTRGQQVQGSGDESIEYGA